VFELLAVFELFAVSEQAVLSTLMEWPENFLVRPARLVAQLRQSFPHLLVQGKLLEKAARKSRMTLLERLSFAQGLKQPSSADLYHTWVLRRTVLVARQMHTATEQELRPALAAEQQLVLGIEWPVGWEVVQSIAPPVVSRQVMHTLAVGS
jgi:hypothetical protein